MNVEKLSKLTSQVRIGGKGTARRKKKVVHRTTAVDDKKLQNTLKKLNVNPIPGFDEAIFFKENVITTIKNPKLQISLPSNTFAITGFSETKSLKEIYSEVAGLKEAGSNNLLSNKIEGVPVEDDIPEVNSFYQNIK